MKQKKTLVVFDGQGGGVGRKIAERLLTEQWEADYIVVGTNAAATSNMMKAGVAAGATGENAWVYNCAIADIIIGPIGIILPNAMRGEISPTMAKAVAKSPAQRILMPLHNPHIKIAGAVEKPMALYLDDLAQLVSAELQK